MRHVLLIVSGSIAAYKSPELIRRGQERGMRFTTVLTAGGAQFITPLTLASIAGAPCYTDLFSLKDEAEMGHIRLSREADTIVVAPASADLIAKMASGRADDLASAVLLATDKPVFIAPAMNPHMWEHPATQANLKTLHERGIRVIHPNAGVMACHEEGTGRMAEISDMLDAFESITPPSLPLQGKRALITAGPTFEPIDPVRFIGNRSSGKQGYAIASALAMAGAEVTLISGPTALTCPPFVTRVNKETALQMENAVLASLPADIAVCTAAVADWRPESEASQKIKKSAQPPIMKMVDNPDILKQLATHAQRPALLIGFAAETESLEHHAKTKLLSKGCDWLVANDVSEGVFGTDSNNVLLITRDAAIPFGPMSKMAVANTLLSHIITYFHSKEMLHAQSAR